MRTIFLVLETPSYGGYYFVNYYTAAWTFEWSQEVNYNAVNMVLSLTSNTPDAAKYFISNSSLKAPNCRPNTTTTYLMSFNETFRFIKLITRNLCPLSIYNLSLTVFRDEFEPAVKYFSLISGNSVFIMMIFLFFGTFNNKTFYQNRLRKRWLRAVNDSNCCQHNHTEMAPIKDVRWPLHHTRLRRKLLTNNLDQFAKY